MDKWKRIATALAAATAIAIPAEGLRRASYLDSGGVITVCYGTTGAEARAGRVYTEQECRDMLDRDMLEAIETVERCVPGLPWQQLAAWADAVYNLGPRIVCDTETSTAARLLKEGRRDEACQQLPRWNKARVAGQLVELPGLTKRRAREMELCLRGFV